jgi:hypothetical protein
MGRRDSTTGSNATSPCGGWSARGVSLGVGLGLWMVGVQALAQIEVEPQNPVSSDRVESAKSTVNVSVSLVTGDCSPLAEESFFRRVRQRSERIAFVNEGLPGASVRAAIRPSASGTHHATLAVLHEDGSSSTRTVEAKSCEEALDALALILVVTFDPSALERPAPAETQETLPPRAAPKPPGAGRALSKKEQRPQSPEALTWHLLAEGRTLRGPTPGWMWGGALGVEMALSSERGPRFRLVGEYLQARHETTDGVAHFGLTAARLSVCPWALLLGPFAAHPCLDVEAGMMQARGSQSPRPSSSLRGWCSLGPGALLRARLGRGWSLFGNADVELTLVRDRYRLAPEPFYETAPLTFGLTAGVARAFP